jgi:hypothetical protein
MRPIRVSSARAWLGVAMCTATGCAMPKPPGELVGVYSIEGALTQNECGEDALPAANPLIFDVELRQDDGTGYWLQGMPPAWPGILTEDGEFSFELEQLYPVDPNARVQSDPFSAMDPEALADPSYYENLDRQTQAEPCQLRIVESVEGTVLRTRASDDAGDGPDDDDDAISSPDLVGDNAIDISAVPGGDCGLVMRDEGGPFDALPCTAHYDLIGTMLREKK